MDSPSDPYALTPREHPLLDDVVPAPPSGPLARPGALEDRLAEHERRGLTEAEALTWMLERDLGWSRGEIARVRGVTRRTVEKTISRARWKLAASGGEST